MGNSQAGSRLGNFVALRGAIEESGLFDPRWYRRQSAEARLWPSALIHYLVRGWRQGLDPSPLFDTSFYVRRYRDVAGSDANPLMHYVLHGRQEGRLATQSGVIYRHSLHPELAPLPIFAVPGTPGSRLSVVVDDNTPRLLGLGYVPLMALACHTAVAAGWSLRIIIRSATITTSDISDALNAGMPEGRPLLEIARREPGHTDDVDTVESEPWWATSLSAFESLRTLVPSSHLHWVMTANEPARFPAGELRVRATSALANPATRIIALADTVDSHGVAGYIHQVGQLPDVLPPATHQSTTSAGIGVVVDVSSPESLVARGIQVIDEALAQGEVNPTETTVCVIGLNEAPLTLMGSVVATQIPAVSPQQWADALGSVQKVVIVRAGTESPDLALLCANRGLAVADITPEPTSGSDGLDDAVSRLAEATPGKPGKSVTWPVVTAGIIAAMEATA